MIRVSLLAKVGRLGKYPQISSVFQCVINTFLGARVMEPDWCVLEFYRESNNSSGFLSVSKFKILHFHSPSPVQLSSSESTVWTRSSVN